MKVLENNYKGPPERIVLCAHCHSKLSITDKDLTHSLDGGRACACPCCHRKFPVLTEAELAHAYYSK